MKNEHVIQSVIPGSIAEECGFEPGDSLLRINGNEIKDIFKDNSYKTLGYTSSGAGIGYLLGDLLSDNKFLPITLAILGGLGGYGISKNNNFNM